MTAQDRALVHQIFTSIREGEDLEYLTDSFLYEACRSFVEQDTGMSFEDFLEHYFNEEGDWV